MKPLVGHWRSLYIRQKQKWLVIGYIEMETGEVRITRQRVYTPRHADHPYAGLDYRWMWEE